MEIWEPKPPGTLWATPGLLRDPFTLLFFAIFSSIACLEGSSYARCAQSSSSSYILLYVRCFCPWPHITPNFCTVIISVLFALQKIFYMQTVYMYTYVYTVCIHTKLHILCSNSSPVIAIKLRAK